METVDSGRDTLPRAFASYLSASCLRAASVSVLPDSGGPVPTGLLVSRPVPALRAGCPVLTRNVRSRQPIGINGPGRTRTCDLPIMSRQL